MSSASDETTAPPEAGGEEGRIRTLDGLWDAVEELKAAVLGGGGQGSESSPESKAPADVQAEVRAELAKLKQAEERKAARDKEKADNEARLAAIEDKVREKPPKEYRKVERFMRWDKDEK